MKKTAVLLLAAALLAVSCSPKKAEGTKLAAGSPAYQLGKDLAALVPQYDPDKNAVRVTAKGFTVTAGDVFEVIHGTMGNAAAQQLKAMPADRLKQALDRAAVQVGERKLFLEAAAKAKLTVAPEEIQKVLESQYAQAGGEAAFLEALKTNGVDAAFVKKMLGDDKLIQKYFEEKVFASIKVGEEDIKKAYAEDKTVSLRHILLMTQGKTEAEKKDVRTKMEGILARARKGEDFAGAVVEDRFRLSPAATEPEQPRLAAGGDVDVAGPVARGSLGELEPAGEFLQRRAGSDDALGRGRRRRLLAAAGVVRSWRRGAVGRGGEGRHGQGQEQGEREA